MEQNTQNEKLLRVFFKDEGTYTRGGNGGNVGKQNSKLVSLIIYGARWIIEKIWANLCGRVPKDRVRNCGKEYEVDRKLLS